MASPSLSRQMQAKYIETGPGDTILSCLHTDAK